MHLTTVTCSHHLRSKKSPRGPLITLSPPSLPLLLLSIGCSFGSLYRSRFYLGRHYRYLVSCLTAGAKRCVGLVPVSFDSFLSSSYLDFPTTSRTPPPTPRLYLFLDFLLRPLRKKKTYTLSYSLYTVGPAFCELSHWFPLPKIPICTFLSSALSTIRLKIRLDGVVVSRDCTFSPQPIRPTTFHNSQFRGSSHVYLSVTTAMLIDGEKWACEACVRGHRVSSCHHSGMSTMISIALIPTLTEQYRPPFDPHQQERPPSLSMRPLSRPTQVSDNPRQVRVRR